MPALRFPGASKYGARTLPIRPPLTASRGTLGHVGIGDKTAGHELQTVRPEGC